MVAGEPNDVRVERANRQWAVLVAEDGKVTQHLFDKKAAAETFADDQRTRLGLPGKPPVDDPRA
ncbi:hypothetical protein LHFGNBLO_004730 [Mesorhizobium sp. AR10]|uniref:hypothetical protein n=1 Tax=Mesorhizobium sp. AR10 TaxID=2865839 RepID=UPI002160508D|nr:hypothetical protein [Mesorhizobium sp. AR10]UVK37658.1 hypothetical protein LHFGNBLO_004730 [Mesorhizobium sp. AR10]